MQTLQLRPDTQDRMVLMDVLVRNEYKLPSFFRPEDVIVDIGAHIGVFAIACEARGAKDIRSYEPDPDNFRLLKEHTANLPVKARNVAVHRSDHQCDLVFSGYRPQWTACGYVVPRDCHGALPNESPVQAIGLDEIVLADIGKPVRLLKMDCEGSEYAILYSASCLDQVQEIVGEVHCLGVTNIPGVDEECTPLALLAYLETKGFTTKMWQHHKLGRNSNANFSAKR
jgi:FkbM family methyltransferase